MAILKDMKSDASGTISIYDVPSDEFEPIKRNESLGGLSGHTGDRKLFTLMYSLDLTGSMYLDDRYKKECKQLVEHLKDLNNLGIRCRVGVGYLRNNKYNPNLSEIADLSDDYISTLEKRLNDIEPEGETVLTRGILDGDNLVIADVEKSTKQGFYCNTPVHIFFSDFQSTESNGVINANLESIFEKEDDYKVIHVYAVTDDAEAILCQKKVSRQDFVMKFTETSDMQRFFSFVSQSVRIASTPTMDVDYSDRRAVGLHVQRGISESLRIHHDDI